MIWIIVGLAITVVASLGIAVWIGLNEFWVRRAERARIDSEVRRAERRLNYMASNAFTSMLDVARGSSTIDPPDGR